MYEWGYGDLHIHCTSRLRVGLWVRSYNALMWSEANICVNGCSLLWYSKGLDLNGSIMCYTSMMICDDFCRLYLWFLYGVRWYIASSITRGLLERLTSKRKDRSANVKKAQRKVTTKMT